MAKKKAANLGDVLAAGARLLVNNVTKEHVLAVPTTGGLCALVPVSVKTKDFVNANHTEVPAE